MLSSPLGAPLPLLASNLFMTSAWYGHLRHKDVPLWQAVVVSWRIAFLEYRLAAPANRYDGAVYSLAQLKTMQEAITLIAAGAAFIFCGKA